MARRRTELEGARDRARLEGYDDPRGTFGGSGGNVIGQVIGGILAGAMQSGALDRVLRDNYRRPKPRADPDFGGMTDAPSWPTPWGGGRADTWGGGDHGGGGGDSGGSGDTGWRTGGSFYQRVIGPRWLRRGAYRTRR